MLKPLNRKIADDLQDREAEQRIAAYFQMRRLAHAIKGQASGDVAPLFQELFTDATNDTGFSNTRATPQYVVTDTGALYPVPAGAIPIQNARPVRNLASANLGTWTAVNSPAFTAGISDPDGGTNATTMLAGANSCHIYTQVSTGDKTANIYANSVWLRRRTGSGDVRVYAPDNIDSLLVSGALTGEWQRFSISGTGGASYVRIQIRIATAGDAIDVYQPQSQDITHRSALSTAPDEYVSTGVGTGEDEVTNGTFDSDLTNWTTSTTGASTALWNDGALELYKAVGQTSAAYQQLNLISGKTYRLTWEKGGGGGTVRVGSTAGATDIVSITTLESVVFTASSSNYLQFNCGTNGETAIIDDVSIKRCDPGLTGIDGFRYFTTALANTVDGSGVVTEGTGAALTGIALANVPGATNFVTKSSDLTGWPNRGTIAISTVGSGYTQYSVVSNLTGANANDVFTTIAGLTADARYEPSLVMRQTTTTGAIVLQSPNGSAFGQWDIDLSQVSTSFERITRDHAAVTVNNEFVATSSGAGGLFFYRKSAADPAQAFDVKLCQLELGTLSTAPIYTSGSTASTDDAVLDFSGVTGFTTPNETRVVATGLNASLEADPTDTTERNIDADDWDGTDLSDLVPHGNIISVTQYAPGERP